MTGFGGVLWLCARFELVLALRSRWLQIFSVVFAGLALAVAGSGYILSGGHGVQDFSRTAISLVQIVLLLVPLAALVFGGLALTPDRGAAELIYSQPVARSAILLGRMLGVWLALTAAELIGFGAAGLVVQTQTGPDGLWHACAGNGARRLVSDGRAVRRRRDGRGLAAAIGIGLPTADRRRLDQSGRRGAHGRASRD